MECDIPTYLCELERIFSPSFFTITMHLPIYLASEASVAGPVHYRWMYPIERYLLTLKRYIKNMSGPEGCIAEGYLAEECLTFCSCYLKGESKLNREVRNPDGVAIGGGVVWWLPRATLEQAHQYILFNTGSMELYRRKHMQFLKENYPQLSSRTLDRKHHLEFSQWVNEHILWYTYIYIKSTR